ncbi:MAG: DUF402 domain-containing protein [Corynebacterium sp.]|nr:DUF402 domain-containing protein [Corynebacterium sp.]
MNHTQRDYHPIKHESFDTATMTNIDPKGFTRSVDTYTVTDGMLYMARGANHPNFGYLESWLIPDLYLRVNVFHYRDGSATPDGIYIDVADIRESDGVWETRDLYVDLFSHDGEPIEVLDIDELATATSAGLLSAEEAERAIDVTLKAVEGITRHGDDPLAWLESQGITLTWADPRDVELVPAD